MEKNTLSEAKQQTTLLERCDQAVKNNQNSLCLDTMNWLCADSMERKLSRMIPPI